MKEIRQLVIRMALVEDPVLLDEILDRALLLAAYPAREGQEQDLKWVVLDRHPTIVARHKSRLGRGLRRGRRMGHYGVDGQQRVPTLCP